MLKKCSFIWNDVGMDTYITYNTYTELETKILSLISVKTKLNLSAEELPNFVHTNKIIIADLGWA